jgi:nicotinamide mononucleotide transporter
MELGDLLEFSAIAFALGYVVLAAKENIWCWLPAFVSSALYAYITWKAQLVGESFISIFYMGMAIYGWKQWHFSNSATNHLLVSEWKLGRHMLAIALGLTASIALGYAFQKLFESAMPYLDAVTTSFSLIATYLVARKVLSNWIYWIIIDALNIFLYWNRDLKMSSAMYLLYTVLAVWAYFSWRKSWKSSQQSLP